MKFSESFFIWFAISTGIVALIATHPTKPIAADTHNLNTRLDIRSLNDSFDSRALYTHLAFTNTYSPNCGLKKPTAGVWKEYLLYVKETAKREFKNFTESKSLNGNSQNSFAIHLRDRFASKLAPSSLFCDSVGQCSIGSCDVLDENLSDQVAYLLFEQLAGGAHYMQGIARATEISGAHFISSIPGLMDRFTSAKQLEEAIRSDIRDRELGQQFAIGFALIGSGIVGMGAVGSVPFSMGLTSAVSGMVSSSYIGIQGVANTHLDKEAPDFSGQIKNTLTKSVGDITHARITNIELDFQNLMKGEPNRVGDIIVDVLTGEEFLSPDPDLLLSIQENEERTNFALVVNILWNFDRPYILDVDAPEGCEKDDRGPSEYRVCLPEFCNRSYWLYAIGRGAENDDVLNKQAYVNGPTDFHAFDKEQNETHLITREDIVRSSLFVHRHGLAVAIDDRNINAMAAAFKKEGVEVRGNDLMHGTSYEEKMKNHLGKVSGAFRIPVCRNPGGEAISSVWSKKGRNYPCMCGEFGWNQNNWSIFEDGTSAFLEQTGFMFSEDCEDYCSNHNKCEGQNNINWHYMLDGKSRIGDPAIPFQLKHPFKVCKKPKDHTTYGKPEKDRLPEPY